MKPQRIGGQRAAAAASQPNVVEFPDVVMHDGSLEFRLEAVAVRAGSKLAGRTLQEANAGETTGVLVVVLRGSDGMFLTNPPMQTPVDAGYILIAIGPSSYPPSPLVRPTRSPALKRISIGMTRSWLRGRGSSASVTPCDASQTSGQGQVQQRRHG